MLEYLQYMCKIYFEGNVGYHLAIAMATKTKTGINGPTDRDVVLKTKLIKLIYSQRNENELSTIVIPGAIGIALHCIAAIGVLEEPRPGANTRFIFPAQPALMHIVYHGQQ